MLTTRRSALMLLSLSLTYPIHAQTPDGLTGKTVRVFVGFTPGGSTDIMARMISEKIGPDLQANFVVVNKPGANSNIAAAEVARSPADGLTLYMGSFNNPINHAAGRKLPFDFLRDFAPIGVVATLPNVLLVSNKLPVHSVQELIAYAKAHPGQLSFGSSGAGSSQHMAGELFKNLAKVHAVHIPYNGSAGAMTDLIGGQIDILFDNMPTALTQVKAGSVRALAVTGQHRAPQMPRLPTMAEAGVPGFDVTSFFALYAPAKTPSALIAAMNAAMNKATAKPEFKQALFDKGAESGGGSPEQTRAFVEGEVRRWSRVIKDAGIRLDD